MGAPLSLILDGILVLIFLGSLWSGYKRGLLRTGLTTLKILLSLGGAYLIQKVLGPSLEALLPGVFHNGVDKLVDSVPPGILQGSIQVLLENLFFSLILFFLLYLGLTLLFNLLSGLVESFFLTRFLNNLGGLVLGAVLGAVATLAAAYLMAIILVMKNPTTAIATIYDTILLRELTADNIQFILSRLGQ